ncbi:hypothetical protein FN846DRAFT_970857 [Sphaerosporella brunnea]|uniref:RanBP2-type domain-containing protein n=1 Tax=Sphaerosporella brunnea TaxID=1250544 RepID=A0A5J5EJA5_9PEZI|nr:hypothetical protein FN846DRAFT_970857 [Sphaerosporella brunnea]
MSQEKISESDDPFPCSPDLPGPSHSPYPPGSRPPSPDPFPEYPGLDVPPNSPETLNMDLYLSLVLVGIDLTAPYPGDVSQRIVDPPRPIKVESESQYSFNTDHDIGMALADDDATEQSSDWDWWLNNFPELGANADFEHPGGPVPSTDRNINGNPFFAVGERPSWRCCRCGCQNPIDFARCAFCNFLRCTPGFLCGEDCLALYTQPPRRYLVPDDDDRGDYRNCGYDICDLRRRELWFSFFRDLNVAENDTMAEEAFVRRFFEEFEAPAEEAEDSDEMVTDEDDDDGDGDLEGIEFWRYY